MIKRALVLLLGLITVAASLGLGLYLTNTAPMVPLLASSDAASGKPFVVKLHARWCPVCMVTKSVWSEIEDVYAGRVNLVVLDFTSEASSLASEAAAIQLGLEEFYGEYEGWTGAIAVLDGRSREVMAALGGIRDFAEYRDVIEGALVSSE